MQYIRKISDELENNIDYINKQIADLKDELREYVECGSTIEELTKLRDDLSDLITKTKNNVLKENLVKVIHFTNLQLKESTEKYLKLEGDKYIAISKYNSLKEEIKNIIEEYRQYKEFIDYMNLKEYEAFQKEITNPIDDDNMFFLNENKVSLNKLSEDFDIEKSLIIR